MKSLKICLAAIVLSFVAMQAGAVENNNSTSLPYGARMIKTGLGITFGFSDRDYDRNPHYYTSSYYHERNRHGYKYRNGYQYHRGYKYRRMHNNRWYYYY